jgi:hypothetical protein
MDVCVTMESVTGEQCLFDEVMWEEFGRSKELMNVLLMVIEY